VRTLKQRNKCQEKRITHFNTIFKELKQKNLIADEHTEILESIGKCNVDLLKRFTAKNNNKTNEKKKYLSKQYSSELRKFALTLLFT